MVLKDNHKLKYLPVSLIIDPGSNIRFVEDCASDTALFQSVKELGIIQSLVVTPAKHGKFQLICGFRRFKAAQKNNLTHVPVMIVNTETSSIYTLIENIQRKDLTLPEFAVSVKSLIDTSKYRYEQISKLTGISKPKLSKLKKLAEQYTNDYRSVSFTKLPESTYLELVNHPELYKKAEDDKWNQKKAREEVSKITDSRNTRKNSPKRLFKTNPTNNKNNNALLPAYYKQCQLETYKPIEFKDNGFTINAFYFNKNQAFDVEAIVEKLQELQNNLDFAIKVIREHDGISSAISDHIEEEYHDVL